MPMSKSMKYDTKCLITLRLHGPCICRRFPASSCCSHHVFFCTRITSFSMTSMFANHIRHPLSIVPLAMYLLLYAALFMCLCVLVFRFSPCWLVGQAAHRQREPSSSHNLVSRIKDCRSTPGSYVPHLVAEILRSLLSNIVLSCL